MARYIFDEERRYRDSDPVNPLDRDGDLPFIPPPDDNSQIDQVTVPQVTADQNNYELPPGQIVIFSTDASRTFTGFKGARPGFTIFCNGGSFDGVVANNNAGSTTENRTLCHTGANITLNPNESAILFYDFANSRWRTVGFV